MAKFCAQCGNAVNETDNVCSQCGYVLNPNANVNLGNNNATQNNTTYNTVSPNQQPAQIYVTKVPVPGRGFGISSLVLGIISLVYSIVLLMPIINYANALERHSFYSQSKHELLSSMFAPVAVFAIIGLLALIFGVCAKGRGYKRGPGSAGLILGLLSLVFSVVDIIVICVNL